METMRAIPITGRPLHFLDAETGAPPVVLLSERLWIRRYGRDPSVVNGSIVIDGVSHSIVGVVAGLRSDTPGLQFDLYAPLPVAGQ